MAASIIGRLYFLKDFRYNIKFCMGKILSRTGRRKDVDIKETGS